MKILMIFFILLFAGCSFKSDQKGIWRKNVSNSFDSYSNYFLKGQNRLALVSLERAIKNAKSSADLEPLSKVYLGVCALHVAVLMDDQCEGYLSLTNVIKKKNKTVSYYNMLQKNYDKVNTEDLPFQYKDFVSEVQKSNFNNALKKAKDMKNIKSMLIAFSLLKEHLDAKEIDFIINQLSIYGYKRALVNWLKYSKNFNIDEKNKKTDKILNIIK